MITVGDGVGVVLRQTGLCLVEIRPGDTQGSSDPVEGSRGEVAVAVPWDGGLPRVGRVYLHFLGPIGLSLELAAQSLQLSAEFPVGHAVTVKVPLEPGSGVISRGNA